jgi:hypothetical protein
MGWRSGPLATLVLLVTISQVASACISPYGFEDFEPTPLVAPGISIDMAPVDVSASTVDDMFPKLVSFGDSLYAFWIKSTGTTFVSENLIGRARTGNEWGPLFVVNNPVPGNGTVEGEHVRIAGFDAAVHGDVLYLVWCTSDPTLANGTDDDPVYRTFDGVNWSNIASLVPPDDGGEDVQPAVTSPADGVLVVWTTSSPILAHGSDQDIVGRLVGPGTSGEVMQISPVGDTDNDFLPRVADTPTGPVVVWHVRSLREVPDTRGVENVLLLKGRQLRGILWRDVEDVSGSFRGENVWVDLMWDGTRLCMVWQHSGMDLAFDTSSIMYREWGLEGLGPIQDISTPLDRAHNGRPALAMVEGEVRVLWHSNDDAITVSDTYDLVSRTREGGGRWSPMTVFAANPDHDLFQLDTANHAGGVHAAWITNVTYDVATPDGVLQVWDVIVAPIALPPDPGSSLTVTPRWVRSTEAWGPDDRIVFEVDRGGRPLIGTNIHVTVMDPDGEVEALLSGTTNGDGKAAFDHVLRSFGDYRLDVAVDGVELGSIGLKVSAPPSGYMDILLQTIVVVALFVTALVMAGYLFIRRKGVADPKAEALDEIKAPEERSFVWRAASRALTKVVRSERAQGYLQIPLFALFIVSIVLGFFGTQDPQANFTTMLGWVYYLPGMLILYAFFGRLWCYVEACGFVDTWAKRLAKGRAGREWPPWLQNMWPAFFLLLAGFWVEIVFSIDLYPWAVATFMTAIIAINFSISANYGKRTYCRFLCRDGVVEELIARFSLFKIGVRTREDSSNHGAACIWKEGEKRPGHCSMCFTCLQNNPDVKEASVTPMVKTFGKDVYRPNAVHRDEAWAALLLMGISIPYMAVLSRAWWIGLFDIANAWSLPGGTYLLLMAGFAMVAMTVATDIWAARRWPQTFTPVRRAVVVLMEALLLGNYFLAVLGGEVGMLIALRTLIVLGAILLPFVVVWIGQRLVVAITENSRGESAGQLLERYGLVFIPVFIGVLIARNLPIVGTWGWAVWDIMRATASNFPGGAAEVVPQPFVDPSLHFALGVAALALGLALGAYTALQISRRIYTDPSHAFRAFTVQSTLLGFVVVLLVGLMALPPF